MPKFKAEKVSMVPPVSLYIYIYIYIYMTRPVWSHVLASSALQTIPDCIRYIIGVFCYTLNHRQIFLLHINTLACVKAEI